MNNPERAVALFKEGFNCSQAVLAAYGEQFELKQELALRVAGAFGGGMGRMGETCGAVTGAIMVRGTEIWQHHSRGFKGKRKRICGCTGICSPV